MKPVIAYKVFLSSDGSLRSFAVPKDDLVTVYRIGEFSTAPVGGFLCFDSYYRAVEYYLRDHVLIGPGSLELWAVEAREPVELPKFRVVHSQVSLRTYQDLWDGQYGSETISRYSCLAFGSWDPGTSAYRKVRPVRPVLVASDFIDDSPVPDPERAQVLARRLLSCLAIPDRLMQTYLLANDTDIGEIESIAQGYQKPSRGTCLRLARVFAKLGAGWLSDSFIELAEIWKDRR
jgi:hypothetical protein